MYKINCTQCNFVYYGQTERSLKTRIAEHRKAVAGFDQNSKLASQVPHFSHIMNFENVKVVGFEANYHERLFLEAWHYFGPERWELSYRTSRRIVLKVFISSVSMFSVRWHIACVVFRFLQCLQSVLIVSSILNNTSGIGR